MRLSEKPWPPAETLVVTDAGGESRAAAACVVRHGDARIKRFSYLGAAPSFEAEFAAGLLGLSTAIETFNASKEIIWFCDNQTLIDRVNQRGFPAGVFSELLTSFHEGTTLQVCHISELPRIKSDHMACHRACRWLQKTELSLEGLPRRVGRLADSAPQKAWTLVDFNAQLAASYRLLQL